MLPETRLFPVVIIQRETLRCKIAECSERWRNLWCRYKSCNNTAGATSGPVQGAMAQEPVPIYSLL